MPAALRARPDLDVRGDGRERRIWGEAPAAESRADGGARLTGYAAVFGTPTTIAGLWREQIAPGAFDDAIGRDDVVALWNHNTDVVLGRTTAGTLTLGVDRHGLRYEIALPDTTWARDLHASIRRGDVRQSSFAFTVTKERWDEPTTPGGLPLRTIEAVTLHDISPCTTPAYPTTSVSARDAAAAYEQRSGAASRSAAGALVDVRCHCGALLARRSPDARGVVEVRCRRCRALAYVAGRRG